MKPEEFLKKYGDKKAIGLQKEDIKRLSKFKKLAKNQIYEGLIISDGYFCFTDTYRLIAQYGTKKFAECGNYTYPKDSIDLMEKSSELLVLTNGALAGNVNGEILLCEPSDENAPKVKHLIDGIDSKGFSVNISKNEFEKGYNSQIWSIINKVNTDDPGARFYFRSSGIEVSVKFDDVSKLVLPIDFESVDKEIPEEIKTALNPKFINDWIKYSGASEFNIQGSGSREAVKFKNGDLEYVVMPLALRD